MSNQIKTKFYKSKYCIVYYTYDEEQFVASFDNVFEICKYKKLAITDNNLQKTKVELYRALKRETHHTTMLNGKSMKVYLIDMSDEIEQ